MPTLAIPFFEAIAQSRDVSGPTIQGEMVDAREGHRVRWVTVKAFGYSLASLYTPEQWSKFPLKFREQAHHSESATIASMERTLDRNGWERMPDGTRRREVY